MEGADYTDIDVCGVGNIPNLEVSKKKRRSKLRKIWQTKEWRDAVKKYIQEHGGKCQWCGKTDALTVHHLYRSAYGMDIYIQLSPSQNIILCRSCHFQLHRGKDRCKCGKYKPMEVEKCWDCLCDETPELKEKMKYVKEQKRKEQKEFRRQQYLKAKKWKKDHPNTKKLNTNKTNGM